MHLIKTSNIYLCGMILGTGFFFAAGGLLHAETPKTDGSHKEYYDTGEKQYDSNYKDGKLQGLTTEYEKDGTVKDKFYFKKDVLVSKQGTETVRDLGPIAFLLRPLFWIIVFAVGTGCWFLFSRVLMKGK